MYFTVHSIAALNTPGGGITWIIANCPISNIEAARDIYPPDRFYIEVHNVKKSTDWVY